MYVIVCSRPFPTDCKPFPTWKSLYLYHCAFARVHQLDLIQHLRASGSIEIKQFLQKYGQSYTVHELDDIVFGAKSPWDAKLRFAIIKQYRYMYVHVMMGFETRPRKYGRYKLVRRYIEPTISTYQPRIVLDCTNLKKATMAKDATGAWASNWNLGWMQLNVPGSVQETGHNYYYTPEIGFRLVSLAEVTQFRLNLSLVQGNGWEAEDLAMFMLLEQHHKFASDPVKDT